MSKAVFLDRDDTLIDDPGYISSPDQVKLLDHIPESLIELRRMGYKLIIVSNQSAVARGIVNEKGLEEIHNRLRRLLAQNGAVVDAIYYCPYHPDGVIKRFRKESELRKPNPGMLYAAAREHGLDLKESWMIGDSPRDVQAGQRAKCKTILIDPPSRQRALDMKDTQPDFKAVNLREAVNIIKKINRNAQTAAAEQTQQNTEETNEQTVEETQAEPIPEKKEEQHDPPQQSEPIPDETSQPPQKQPQPETNEDASPSNNEPAEQLETETDTTELENKLPINSEIREMFSEILTHLRWKNRDEDFDDFSIFGLLAGIAQGLVFFCLLLSVWFLLMSNPEHPNRIFVSLGFAAVLQIMSLTFHVMREKR